MTDTDSLGKEEEAELEAAQMLAPEGANEELLAEKGDPSVPDMENSADDEGEPEVEPEDESPLGEQPLESEAAPDQAAEEVGEGPVQAVSAVDEIQPLEEFAAPELLSGEEPSGEAEAELPATADVEPEISDPEAEDPGAEAEILEAAEEPDDGRMWYVVHCYSGYENKVRHNLEQRIDTMGMKDRIFDVVVPTEEEIEVKDGKRRTVERRVFPGYILVQMLMGEESWYVVRNTPGVTGFVGMGNEPTPLRPEEVSQIIKRMEAEAPRIKVTYSQGQKVRIIDGPFNDFIGTVEDIDMERAKVRVMVSFFGRETPVELDFLQVEKA